MDYWVDFDYKFEISFFSLNLTASRIFTFMFVPLSYEFGQKKLGNKKTSRWDN